jgi:hypothetical protein
VAFANFFFRNNVLRNAFASRSLAQPAPETAYFEPRSVMIFSKTRIPSSSLMPQHTDHDHRTPAVAAQSERDVASGFSLNTKNQACGPAPAVRSAPPDLELQIHRSAATRTFGRALSAHPLPTIHVIGL